VNRSIGNRGITQLRSKLHREELETDLIATHVLSTRLVPAAQFIG